MKSTADPGHGTHTLHDYNTELSRKTERLSKLILVFLWTLDILNGQSHGDDILLLSIILKLYTLCLYTVRFCIVD